MRTTLDFVEPYIPFFRGGPKAGLGGLKSTWALPGVPGKQLPQEGQLR